MKNKSYRKFNKEICVNKFIRFHKFLLHFFICHFDFISTLESRIRINNNKKVNKEERNIIKEL